MPQGPTPEVTRLLLAWRDGDEGAFDRLVPLVYRELHRLAHARMRGQRPGTLQTTALVNEAYLRLVGEPNVSWDNRVHFFSVCARAMRSVLVDAARARASLKRGGDQIRVPFHEAQLSAPVAAANVLAVDEALTELAKDEPRKARVVELRYFGGLSVEETARAVGVSVQTVMRDWNMAKLLLVRILKRGLDNRETDVACGQERDGHE
jgi:RNA polymerase sigma-70 factor, ECF subfamily